MFKRFSLPLLCALSVGVLGANSLSAQTSALTVTVEKTDVNIAPAGAAPFNILIKNNGTEALSVRVYRESNQMPNEEWTSAICFGGLCYSPETDAPAPYVLNPGAGTSCELTIGGGSTVGQTATVELSIGAGFDTNRIVKKFVVTTTNASGVDITSNGTLSKAYPNPASTSTLLPLPAKLNGSAFSMGLFNTRGEMVADLTADARTAVANGSGALRLDVSTLNTGAYFYRVTNNGTSSTGSIVVAR